MPYQSQHNGAVLLIVLWFITLISLLVAGLASEVRLSAKAVYHHQESLQDGSKIQKAIHLAQFELMLQRMPPLPEETKPRQDGSPAPHPLARFNGDQQILSHPLPEGIKVRIYDHAGLINIRRLNTQRWRELFRQRIGEDDILKLDSLVQTWQDWIDNDDLKRANGAEKEYYQKQKPPYAARNAQPETIEELLLLKGFDEIFKEVDLASIFTVYGNTAGVNPNFATVEALSFLPGLNKTLAQAIIQLRYHQDIKSFSDLNEILLPEQSNKARKWLNFSKTGSNFYSIAILKDKSVSSAHKDKTLKKPIPNLPKKNQTAYVAVVEARGYALPPRIVRINPYATLPETIVPPLPEDILGSPSKPHEPASFLKSNKSSGSPFAGMGSTSNNRSSNTDTSNNNQSSSPFSK